MMDVRISASGDDAMLILESLEEWLRAEPSLTGRVRLARKVPSQGEMGALADALVVAVSAGGSITILASALQSWVSQPRRAAVRVRIATGHDGRREIELDSEGVDVRKIETFLRAAIDASGQ